MMIVRQCWAMTEQAIPVIALSGNRCGHMPDAPRLTLFKPFEDGKKKRPLVLGKLAERFKDYYDNPDVIPSLNLANGSTRKQRSEGREACVLTGLALIKFLDLRTLCVGIPKRVPSTNDIIFAPLPAKTLAVQAGLPLRRVTRALRLFRRAGMLTSSQPRKMDEDGKYIGLPAVRAVSEDLFGAFGLIEMLKKERKKRNNKQDKQEKSALRQGYDAMTKTAKARGGLMLKGMMAQAKEKRYTRPDTAPPCTAAPPEQAYDANMLPEPLPPANYSAEQQRLNKELARAMRG